ncbi:TNT antitoxin family protein [Mycobacterium shimoidei]|uniref:TNT antitoxin family protein n=1 Tax=Mycobacterium shimoidei TaxID=29313 RepID=UPI000A031058|nr:TNT antitoxin family protein [Mycobacterium shimoidei]MCV7257083.1 TNT antitoxin family protein [Mycobacterium shimoidei]
MIEPIDVSPRLAEWANLADFTLTPGRRTDDGRALFWSVGGETRLFIGKNHDGCYLVTDSFRMGPEKFRFAAPLMDTVERYLLGRFGEDIRALGELPPVHIPGSEEEISAGFTIDSRPFAGVERRALIASDGSTVAIISGGKLIATIELVALSLYLTTTVDDIVTSFLDPGGKPLFRPR